MLYVVDSLKRTDSWKSIIWESDYTLAALQVFDSLKSTDSYESFAHDLDYTRCQRLHVKRIAVEDNLVEF